MIKSYSVFYTEQNKEFVKFNCYFVNFLRYSFRRIKVILPKTEGKSFLFHIENEFPYIISIKSEVGFYFKAFQLGNLYPDFCNIFLVVSL